EMNVPKDSYARRGANAVFGAMGAYAAGQVADGAMDYISSRIPAMPESTSTAQDTDVVIDADGDAYYDAPQEPLIKRHVESPNLKDNLQPKHMAMRGLLSVGEDIPEPQPPNSDCPTNKNQTEFSNVNNQLLIGGDNGYCSEATLRNMIYEFKGHSVEKADITVSDTSIAMFTQNAGRAINLIVQPQNRNYLGTYATLDGNTLREGYVTAISSGGEDVSVRGRFNSLLNATVVSRVSDQTGFVLELDSCAQARLYSLNSGGVGITATDDVGFKATVVISNAGGVGVDARGHSFPQANFTVQNTAGVGLKASEQALKNSTIVACQNGVVKLGGNSAANAQIKIQDSGSFLLSDNAGDEAEIIATGNSILKLNKTTSSLNITLCHNAKILNLTGFDIVNDVHLEINDLRNDPQSQEKICGNSSYLSNQSKLPTSSTIAPAASSAFSRPPSVSIASDIPIASEAPPSAEGANVGGIVAGVLIVGGVIITISAIGLGVTCYIKREAIARLIERLHKQGVNISEQQAEKVVEGVAIDIAKQTHPEIFESQQNSEQQGAAVKSHPTQKTVTISLKQLEEGFNEACKITETAAGKASEGVDAVMRQAARDLSIKSTVYS
ncbi:hypothetical protein D5018_21075, partial [Parashewanella curva]